MVSALSYQDLFHSHQHHIQSMHQSHQADFQNHSLCTTTPKRRPGRTSFLAAVVSVLIKTRKKKEKKREKKGGNKKKAVSNKKKQQEARENSVTLYISRSATMTNCWFIFLTS